MDAGTQIVLDELREHRREFQAFRTDTANRLQSLEITRAEDKGSKKVLTAIGGGSLLGAISFIATIWKGIGNGP